jgi:hypothetical protein
MMQQSYGGNYVLQNHQRRLKMNWNDPKHLLGVVAVIVVVIVGLYYVMSPYQNCKDRYAENFCYMNTSW